MIWFIKPWREADRFTSIETYDYLLWLAKNFVVASLSGESKKIDIKSYFCRIICSCFTWLVLACHGLLSWQTTKCRVLPKYLLKHYQQHYFANSDWILLKRSPNFGETRKNDSSNLVAIRCSRTVKKIRKGYKNLQILTSFFSFLLREKIGALRSKSHLWL